MRPGLTLGNASDVGRERDVNEDYFGYAEPEADELFRRKGRLLIVSDGMGGAAGGDVASRMVVDTVRSVYHSATAAEPREAMASAIEEANRRIFERAQASPDLRGMGATCTTVAIVGDTAYVAHVGDTRAYLVRGGSAVQLTEDQSLVARMVREGVITPEEAQGHPKSNVIEQAVGQKAVVKVDVSVPPQPLEPGDILVLCTDGLHGLVPPAEIARIVTAAQPSDAAKILVDVANGRGGPDNITVQVARLGPSPASAATGVGGAAGGATWRVPPAVAVGSLLLAAVVGGLFVYFVTRGSRADRPAPVTCADAERPPTLDGPPDLGASGDGATAAVDATEVVDHLPDAGAEPAKDAGTAPLEKQVDAPAATEAADADAEDPDAGPDEAAVAPAGDDSKPDAGSPRDRSGRRRRDAGQG